MSFEQLGEEIQALVEWVGELEDRIERLEQQLDDYFNEEAIH